MRVPSPKRYWSPPLAKKLRVTRVIAGAPSTTAPSLTSSAPSARVMDCTLVPSVVTVSSSPICWAVPAGSYTKLNPATWAKRPLESSTRETAFSNSTFTWAADTSSITVTKLPNGEMLKVSNRLIGPTGITESLRMPPPFWMATTGWGTPKSAAKRRPFHNRASASRLPWLVSWVRMPGERRPSRGTSVVPTGEAASSASAAATGVVTCSTASGWGSTASGSSPPATRRSPLVSSMAATLPSASMVSTSWPT